MNHKYIYHLLCADKRRSRAVIIASNPEEAKHLAHITDPVDYWFNAEYRILATCLASLASRVLAIERKYEP